jgi:hypothetical protein
VAYVPFRKGLFRNKDDLREPTVKVAQQQQLDRKEGKERWERRRKKNGVARTRESEMVIS